MEMIRITKLRVSHVDDDNTYVKTDTRKGSARPATWKKYFYVSMIALTRTILTVE